MKEDMNKILPIINTSGSTPPLDNALEFMLTTCRWYGDVRWLL